MSGSIYVLYANHGHYLQYTRQRTRQATKAMGSRPGVFDDNLRLSMVITTKRLLLRPWCEEDFEPFAQLNADPRVMEFFPSVLNREESDDLAKRIIAKMEEQG